MPRQEAKHAGLLSMHLKYLKPPSERLQMADVEMQSWAASICGGGMHAEHIPKGTKGCAARQHMQQVLHHCVLAIST